MGAGIARTYHRFVTLQRIDERPNGGRDDRHVGITCWMNRKWRRKPLLGERCEDFGKCSLSGQYRARFGDERAPPGRDVAIDGTSNRVVASPPKTTGGSVEVQCVGLGTYRWDEGSRVALEDGQLAARSVDVRSKRIDIGKVLVTAKGPDRFEQCWVEYHQRNDLVVLLSGACPSRVFFESQVVAEPNDASSGHFLNSIALPGWSRRLSNDTITTVAFEVETQVYNGPFDLLLHLILSEEVELYEISLSTIVDAYLTEIEKMEHLDLDVATEFLLIAATLVELKARRLLPDDDSFDLDDELALFEERDLLLSRLVECKTFKDAAGILRQLHDAGGRTYPRVAGVEEKFLGLAPDMLEGIDVNDVHDAFVRAMTPKPEPILDLYHVSAVTASVSDAVREFVDELPGAGRVNFRDLTSGLVDRIEVVVRFLAILELFKQGMVDIRQAEAFGNIQLEWVGGDPAGALSALAIDVYDG